MSNQRSAILRVCASCEWIFRRADAEDGSCPMCGFAHYGARYVYGPDCYKYERTQEPWHRKQDPVKLHKRIRDLQETNDGLQSDLDRLRAKIERDQRKEVESMLNTIEALP